MHEELAALLSRKDTFSVTAEDAERFTEFFKTQFKKLLTEAKLHPLGFIYSSEPISTSLTLRFHLWVRGYETPESQRGAEIHDHIFHQTSLLVHGRLKHKTFEIISCRHPSHQVYQVVYEDSTTRLEQTGERGCLVVASDEVRVRGSIYRLPPHVLHTVIPLSTPAATIVLAESRDTDVRPKVVGRFGAATPPPFNRATLTPDQAMAVMEVVNAM